MVDASVDFFLEASEPTQSRLAAWIGIRLRFNDRFRRRAGIGALTRFARRCGASDRRGVSMVTVPIAPNTRADPATVVLLQEDVAVVDLAVDGNDGDGVASWSSFSRRRKPDP
jgi:hypothetical protein